MFGVYQINCVTACVRRSVCVCLFPLSIWLPQKIFAIFFFSFVSFFCILSMAFTTSTSLDHEFYSNRSCFFHLLAHRFDRFRFLFHSTTKFSWEIPMSSTHRSFADWLTACCLQTNPTVEKVYDFLSVFGDIANRIQLPMSKI